MTEKGNKGKARSLKGIALVVTLGTLLSKAGGMLRQLVIAAAFGVGEAYDAYNYAYVLPGFLLILLGGINGPFHNAMVSVLSRRPHKERAHILASLNSMISAVLIVVTAALVLTADQLIGVLGPSMSSETHSIAVVQLQVMAPIALLAGLIGLGFGSLNAANVFWLPAASPLMTSLALIIGVGLLRLQFGNEIGSTKLAFVGGIVLAFSTLIGALLQWLIQIPALLKYGLIKPKLTCDWKHPGVQEVLKVMGPATLSSGMLQINVFTDLFFASGISGAAAGLSYANLLIQAPLGLISNALIVPLLPIFSQLASDENKSKLIKRVKQGLIISTASMIILGTLFIVLSSPIVTLMYKRGAFDNNATNLVTSLLIAYGIGMPVYLGRDLLVRVFYALGDGITPFRLSSAGIGLNIIFDWLLIGGPSPWGMQSPFNFGASGLVLATVVVNFFTCAALINQLYWKLGGLPLGNWANDGIKLVFSGITTGFVVWHINHGIDWSTNFFGTAMAVFFPASIGLCLFGVLSISLGINEISQIVLSGKNKFLTR